MIVCITYYYHRDVWEATTIYFQELFTWVQEHGLWPEEGVEKEP